MFLAQIKSYGAGILLILQGSLGSLCTNDTQILPLLNSYWLWNLAAESLGM